MGHGINNNNLDPRLQKIVDIIDRRNSQWLQDLVDIMNELKKEFDPGNYDHAYQDIRDTLERRMIRRKKKWFGLF